MNRKISRNEKRKQQNEKKLALGEDKNTNALMLPRRMTATFMNFYNT